MGSLAEEMRSVRAEVFEEIGERLLVGSESVPGKFSRRSQEIQTGNGVLTGVEMAFDCQTCPAVEGLQKGDSVQIGYPDDAGVLVRTEGPYRVERVLLPKGTESGLVMVQLGNFRATA